MGICHVYMHSRPVSSAQVSLADGSTLEAALLVGSECFSPRRGSSSPCVHTPPPPQVGSDGIFSTVRRQLKLAGERLKYAGLVVVLGIAYHRIA